MLDMWVRLYCQEVKRNLAPYFQWWGFELKVETMRKCSPFFVWKGPWWMTSDSNPEPEINKNDFWYRKFYKYMSFIFMRIPKVILGTFGQ